MKERESTMKKNNKGAKGIENLFKDDGKTFKQNIVNASHLRVVK